MSCLCLAEQSSSYLVVGIWLNGTCNIIDCDGTWLGKFYVGIFHPVTDYHRDTGAVAGFADNILVKFDQGLSGSDQVSCLNQSSKAFTLEFDGVNTDMDEYLDPII